MPYGFSTELLHSDRLDKPEHGSLHSPIHSSVAYGYDEAKKMADVFQGKANGYLYGRQSNPTVTALENKITKMEEGVATICFSTGMGAITALLFSLLNKGDHFISSQFLFGNTASLLTSFNRMGLEVSFVDATAVKAVEQAIKPNTKLVFVETIANPATQIADLPNVANLCRERNLIYTVDNTLTSPYSFKPKNIGATFSINSLTKYIGGHGNALGGSLTDLGNYEWGTYSNVMDIYKKFPTPKWGITQIRKKGIRDMGATMSPESAHKLSIGSDTLTIRYEKQSQNALELATFLNNHPRVQYVNYPGLDNHPQKALAQKLFKTYGAILSFDLIEGLDCLKILDKLKIIICSSNLGDNRTLTIPVAKTIFFEIGKKRRKAMGISESLIRLSVGIEDCKDLIGDLSQALEEE